MGKVGWFVLGLVVGYLVSSYKVEYIRDGEEIIEVVEAEPKVEAVVSDMPEEKIEVKTVSLVPQIVDYGPEDDEPDIQLISFEEFEAGDKLDYDKETMTFYSEDHVLVDCDGEIAPNEEDIVGDSLQSFGDEAKLLTGDSDVIYVRHHALSVDYEIVRVNKRYAEEVLGIYKED